MRTLRSLVCLLPLLAVACAGLGRKKAATTAPKDPMAGCKETVAWSSHETRPAWTLEEPSERDGSLYFVGLSDKTSTEKDARESALRAAIKNVVQYIGTDVRTRFESIRTSHGLSTDILDPSVAAKEFEEQLSAAMARRVKPTKWYLKKLSVKCRGSERIAHTAFVLAVAPKSEIDASTKEQVAKQEKVAKAAQAANKKIAVANALVVEAEQIMGADPEAAFAKLTRAITEAEAGKVDAGRFPELNGVSTTVETLLAKSKELLTKARRGNAAKVIVLLFPKNAALSKYRKTVEGEVAGQISYYDERPVAVSEEFGIVRDTDIDYDKFIFKAGFLFTGTYSTEYLGDKILMPDGTKRDFQPSYYGKIDAKLIRLHNKEVLDSRNISDKGFGPTKAQAERTALQNAAKLIAEELSPALPPMPRPKKAPPPPKVEEKKKEKKKKEKKKSGRGFRGRGRRGRR